ncbi:hypothetical protein AB8U03_16685 [Clostridium sp. Mt-5]|uniref:50S ribosomal protein L29 n=1 Tax=Clostridium moutaii TaxID=3240932 RepID=A0ABV4BSN9_9CLOT
MNKYQREKAKRMKKLSELGIGYSQQKALLRKFNFEQLDKTIKQIEVIEKSDAIKKLIKSFEKSMKILSNALLRLFKEKNQK